MGAKETEIAGKPALDVTTVKLTKRRFPLFLQCFNEVAGRSGKNRRHTDRNGNPIYVVTDDFETARTQSMRVLRNQKANQ